MPSEPAAAARRRPRRVLVMPAYNEGAHLEEVVADVVRTAPEFEVVVVDDGSLDGTAAAARAAGADVVRHPYNLGYGAALQTGYKYAHRRGAEIVVQMDADGQHDPADIRTLTEPVEEGELDLVVGSRFLGAGDYEMGWRRNLGRWLFRAVAAAFDLRITDPTSGFQAMNRKVLELYIRDFFPSDYPDVDVLIAGSRRGLAIGERPVRMGPGVRGSTLHQQLIPVRYLYGMALSIWATTPRRAEDL